MIHKFFRSLMAPAKDQTADAAPASPSPETQSPEATPDESSPEPARSPLIRQAKYQIGQVVHHRMFDFRGVIFDVDPEFANSEDWYQSIPEDIRPHRDQPYYHLFAENAEGHYTAYVSEQNLVIDETDAPIKNPDLFEVFTLTDSGHYQLRAEFAN